MILEVVDRGYENSIGPESSCCLSISIDYDI